jgi:hypothetical protein
MIYGKVNQQDPDDKLIKQGKSQRALISLVEAERLLVEPNNTLSH